MSESKTLSSCRCRECGLSFKRKETDAGLELCWVCLSDQKRREWMDVVHVIMDQQIKTLRKILKLLETKL